MRTVSQWDELGWLAAEEALQHQLAAPPSNPTQHR